MTGSRLRRIVLVGVLLSLGTASTGFAQPPQGRGGGARGQGPQGRGLGQPREPTPRDPSQPQPVIAGTAVVSDTVVVAGTGQPARRARVVLNATDGGRSRTATTDETGSYAFHGLGPGRYTLSASKTGHVGVTYGQTRPGRPGTAIQLAEGEKFSANLQLPRGSVITGTILDEYGEPSPGTQVRVLRYVMQAGRRTLQQSGSGSTDDRGIYRVYGLQPGEYIVSVVPRNTGPTVDVARLQAELETVRQRIATAGPEPGVARELAARALMLQSEIPQQQEEQATGYAPVYFPGTVSPNDAGSVTVGLGEERTSVDFQLQRVPMARVEGMVVNSTGVATQNVQLTLSNAAQSIPGLGTISARADAEGRFRLTSVPPGTYRLVARANTGPAGRGGPEAVPAGRGGRAGGAPSAPIRLWGSVDVPVEGRDITNVIVTLQQGLTVSGRIAFEGTTQQPPGDLTRVRVNLAPADPSARELTQPAAGTVDAAGKFTIPSVVPGIYRLTASGAGSGWVLESSVVDGHDSLDFPFEVKPGAAPTTAVITFSDRQADLSGTLTDQRGRPAPGFTLILYPADERFWGPQSRRIRSARPDTAGHYTFSSIPPGEYRLSALTDVEPGTWFDPAFLQQLEAASTRVTVSEGEKKVQNLQVAIGGPDRDFP